MYKMLLISGVLCFSTSVFAQESISEDDFEERHSSQAVSGINARLSVGFSYIDTGEPANLTIPRVIDPSFGIPTIGGPFFPELAPFIIPRENKFQGTYFEGSLAFPINNVIGFQVDGIYSDHSSNRDRDFSTLGIGGHLFLRDHEKGLFGIYGHYVEYGERVENYQIGVEAQIYHENLSLELFAGFDSLEVIGQNTILQDIGSGSLEPSVVVTSFGEGFFSTDAIAAFYLADNFRASAGVSHSFEETSFLAGLEWQPENTLAPNLFINAQFGEDVSTVRAGIRFNFGRNNKSLIQNHREGALQTRLLNNSASLLSCSDNIAFNSFQTEVAAPITPVAQNLGGRVPTSLGFEPLGGIIDGCEVLPSSNELPNSIDQANQ